MTTVWLLQRADGQLDAAYLDKSDAIDDADMLDRHGVISTVVETVAIDPRALGRLDAEACCHEHSGYGVDLHYAAGIRHAVETLRTASRAREWRDAR